MSNRHDIMEDLGKYQYFYLYIKPMTIKHKLIIFSLYVDNKKLITMSNKISKTTLNNLNM